MRSFALCPRNTLYDVTSIPPPVQFCASRHRYDLAIESEAAAAASEEQHEKHQRSQPPRKGPSANGIFDAASLEIEGGEPTKPRRATTGAPRGEPQVQVLLRSPRLNGPLPPLSPPRSCVINATKNRTRSAGVVAAKAAAAEAEEEEEEEEEEEGYGTESMTSASEASLAAGDNSEADSDDNPNQEHRAKVLGRMRLWAPAAAARRRPPRRVICALDGRHFRGLVCQSLCFRHPLSYSSATQLPSGDP